MLKMWIFILMIDGQPLGTFPSDTEASCNRTMALILASQQAAGKQATGACYVRVAGRR